MQVAQAVNDQLLGLVVARGLETGVFVAQPLQGAADLLLVAAGRRLQGQGEHRLGQRRFHGPARDLAVVDEVADLELLDLGQGDDVAGQTGLDLLVLAALGLEDVARPEALPLVVAQDVGVGLHRAAEDPDGRVLHVRLGIIADAEDQARQRTLGVGLDLDRLVAVLEHHGPGRRPAKG